MRTRSLSGLSDGTLRRELASLVSKDRATTAELLACLAEFDTRKLYAEDGYSSLFNYCVQFLRFSEDMAYKRIQAARAARDFPSILEAVADGRLHLTAVVCLAPHLNPENAEELLRAAIHKTKAEIELLLAHRFPKPDVPTVLRALTEAVVPSNQLVPEPVVQFVPNEAATQEHAFEAPTPRDLRELVPEPVPTPTPARVKPLAPQRFALQVTITQETRDKLRLLQDLLGHQIPSGDVARVLDRALDALLREVQRTKNGATDRPRSAATRPSSTSRHIPNGIKRQVWERDGGRCTYVSDSGHRCEERKVLEYDHVHEFSRGGRATLGGIRLLCKTHNQIMAERTFGLRFMQSKIEARNQSMRCGTVLSSRSVESASGSPSPGVVA